MSWYVYILYSEKIDKFYTGCSIDFEQRFEKHKSKFYGTLGFTTKADDWEIFLHFPCTNEQQAKSIEQHIKKMKSKTEE